jgi:hypothetical protein
MLAAFVCLVSWAGARAGDSQKEVLNFKIGDDWKAVSHSDTGRGHSITYIREGDDLEHWKEIFTYLYGVRRRGLRPPDQEFSILRRDVEKRLPGLTDWSVIAQDDSSILYEWHTNWSARTHEEWNITRIIHTKYNWFTLTYAARVHELAPDTRAQWIKTFSDATIGTDSTASPERWNYPGEIWVRTVPGSEAFSLAD